MLTALCLQGCKSSFSKNSDAGVDAAKSNAFQLLEGSAIRVSALGADCQAISLDQVGPQTTHGDLAKSYKRRDQVEAAKCTRAGQGYDCSVEYLNNASEDTAFMVRISFEKAASGHMVASSESCLLAG